jgi:hypothetical protein
MPGTGISAGLVSGHDPRPTPRCETALEESERGIGACSASLIFCDPEHAALSCERREADRLLESALTVFMADVAPDHEASREVRRLAKIEDE